MGTILGLYILMLDIVAMFFLRKSLKLILSDCRHSFELT